MTDYFSSAGSKPTIKSDKPYSRGDARPELLLDYLDRQPRPLEIEPDEIENCYNEWFNRMLNKFNICVTGSGSKYRLLQTFKEKYLDSIKLKNKNIVTVRLHGMMPIALENFANRLFGCVKAKAAMEKQRFSFLDWVDLTKTHHFFMIHSFELFYENCRDIWDQIFYLCRKSPELFHLIMSSDHVNSGKIMGSLKLELWITYSNVKCNESFFYEKAHACLNDGVPVMGALVDQNLDLNSLKDVHQAMQKSCQSVMVYILRYHMGNADISLQFNQLLEHCQARFWVRRANSLRAHLGELIDHKIIELEGNSIRCLIEAGTCRKFLQSIGEEEAKD